MASFYFFIALTVLVISVNQVHPAVVNNRGKLKPSKNVVGSDRISGSDNTQSTSNQSPGNGGEEPAPMIDGENEETPTQPTEEITEAAIETTTQVAVDVTNNQFPSEGGAPPPATSLNCADYTCVPGLSGAGGAGGPECNNKPQTSIKRCKISNSDSNYCYGVYCMNISPSTDYCICSPEQIGDQCVALKPGSCDSATGILPAKHRYIAQNKRWREIQRPDSGSVYARHFAATGTDCIRLCQWSNGKCNSVNYGPLNGVQLCELLSVIVTNGSMMEPWLINAPGWQYTTVVGKAAAI